MEKVEEKNYFPRNISTSRISPSVPCSFSIIESLLIFQSDFYYTSWEKSSTSKAFFPPSYQLGAQIFHVVYQTIFRSIFHRSLPYFCHSDDELNDGIAADAG